MADRSTKSIRIAHMVMQSSTGSKAHGAAVKMEMRFICVSATRFDDTRIEPDLQDWGATLLATSPKVLGTAGLTAANFGIVFTRNRQTHAA